MKLILVADSLELNGGCIMFLETLGAFRKYSKLDIEGYVVSKSGNYGRPRLCDDNLGRTYTGESIRAVSYEEVGTIDFRGATVLHHRNAHTKPLFPSVPYFVVNHVVDEVPKIANFKHATRIISVCRYVQSLSSRFAKSSVVLNGIENDYVAALQPADLGGGFITGRCHRLVPTKYSPQSLGFLENLPVPGHKHIIIGPMGDSSATIRPNRVCTHVGAIFDRFRKMSMIKAFDVYFYDTFIKEGASVAILEALACGVPVMCKPLGGNMELVKHGVNGFLYHDYAEAQRFLKMLASDRGRLVALKQSTQTDFANRLHIKRLVKEYTREFGNVQA